MREESINIDGYQASTKDLNSPEIMRLAYSPQMNAYIDSLKKQRKNISDSSSRDIALEATDHIVSKARGRVMSSSKKVTLSKIKPKYCCICQERVFTCFVIEGKIYGECHKSQSGQRRIEQARKITKS